MSVNVSYARFGMDNAVTLLDFAAAIEFIKVASISDPSGLSFVLKILNYSRIFKTISDRERMVSQVTQVFVILHALYD
jgi:hypothetical protein